jgi:hypothetical protein
VPDAPAFHRLFDDGHTAHEHAYGMPHVDLVQRLVRGVQDQDIHRAPHSTAKNKKRRLQIPEAARQRGTG